MSGLKTFLQISVFLLSLTVVPSSVYGQCDEEEFLDNCADLLNDFVFIKSFDVKGEGKKTADGIEYSYVFSKGTTYMITICDENQEENKMILELFDRTRKPLLSSFSKKSKKHYNQIQFPCSATGVYYLKYSFAANKTACGVSILGFKK